MEINPDKGWFFNKWDGEHCCDVYQSQGLWQLLMDSNKRLTPVFKPVSHPDKPAQPQRQYSLDVKIKGDGIVEPNIGIFMVYLQVLPSNGWTFSHWAGANQRDVINTSNRWAIVMEDNKKLTAIFLEDKFNLDLEVIDQGWLEKK